MAVRKPMSAVSPTCCLPAFFFAERICSARSTNVSSRDSDRSAIPVNVSLFDLVKGILYLASMSMTFEVP